MYTLPRRETIKLIQQRITALEGLIKTADVGIADAAQTVPAIFLSEERYAQHMRIAERDWFVQFAEQLSSDH